MVKFTHYLVTRFNVPVENWNRDKAGLPTLHAEWMAHRMILFTTYCVPTVKAQTNKEFQWIIYCDKNISHADKSRIQDLVSTVSGTTIRLVSDLKDMMTDLRVYISAASTPFVITTRLDNDDGIGKHLIQSIQDNFSETDKLLLNPVDGIQYAVHDKIMTHLKFSQKNHYTSLIEKNTAKNTLLTVLGFSHDAPPANITIRNISGKRMYLKIIHEKNVKSLLKGIPVFNPGEIYFDAVSEIAFPVSFINTLKYTFRRTLQKLFRL